MEDANIRPRVRRVVSCGVSLWDDRLKLFTVVGAFWYVGLGLPPLPLHPLRCVFLLVGLVGRRLGPNIGGTGRCSSAGGKSLGVGSVWLSSMSLLVGREVRLSAVSFGVSFWFVVCGCLGGMEACGFWMGSRCWW